MINPFKSGDIKVFETRVTADKLAEFEVGEVHPVYGTFALGRDAEWACRLFVLEMKQAGEEGIGTFLSIDHHYPAPLGSNVRITATLESVEKNAVICSWIAESNGRKIASGRQGQKIIDKSRFDKMIREIEVS